MENNELVENTGDGHVKINKIPLGELLEVLEGLYESGCDYIDMEFKIDPNSVQNVLSITTRPDYMASEEQLAEEEKMYEELGFDNEEDDDDDEDEEDDILARIRKEQEEKDKNQISDDDIDNLL